MQQLLGDTGPPPDSPFICELFLCSPIASVPMLLMSSLSTLTVPQFAEMADFIMELGSQSSHHRTCHHDIVKTCSHWTPQYIFQGIPPQVHTSHGHHDPLCDHHHVLPHSAHHHLDWHHCEFGVKSHKCHLPCNFLGSKKASHYWR